MQWKIGSRTLHIQDKSLLMGILNITPDSFSDGGRYNEPGKALAHAQYLIESGAAILDIGGESTRPGSEPVSPEKERSRVIPIIKHIKSRFPDILLSLDTRNASTAGAGLEAGADIINDISGLNSEEMLSLCKKSSCGLVVMHMQGEPRTMQNNPHYEDVVEEVSEFFKQRFLKLTEAGIESARICFDPGIGFGKSFDHNVELIRRINELDPQGCCLLMALSRKRFLTELLGSQEAGRSPLATAAATVICHRKGIRLHRVHDVLECSRSLAIEYALDGV